MRPRTKWKISNMAGNTSSPRWLIGLTLAVIYLSSVARCAQDKPKNSKATGSVQFHNLLPDFAMDYEEEEKFLANVDKTQETVDPRKWSGLDIRREAVALALTLNRLSNAEMGATKMQEIYDSMPYTRRELNEQKQVDELASKLGRKIHKFQQVLRANKRLVENLYKFHIKKPITRSLNCCMLNDTSLSYEDLYGCGVSRDIICDLVPHSLKVPTFNPGRNLTLAFRHSQLLYSTLKWQYFLSSEGVHNEYPAHTFTDCSNVHDTRHREVYVATVQPQRKNVIIMVDHGKAMSANQLRTAKAVAKHVLESLNENDRVGVLALSDRVTYPHVEDCLKASYPRADDCLSIPLQSKKDRKADECLSKKMTALTVEAKIFLKKFVDNLEKQEGATAHALGFQKAFNLLANSTSSQGITDGEDHLIVYISRGLLSSLTDAKDIFQTIAIENARVQNQVIINTYAVTDVWKPIMFELSFLRDIAAQNYTKYTIKSTYPTPPKRGVMVTVNSTHDLSVSIGGFYKVFNRSTPDDKIRFSLPRSDIAGRGLVVSLSLPCFHDNDKVIGVMGVDVHLSEIVQNVTYFSQEVSSYAFVIDSNGYTIMHPALQRPLTTKVQPMHTDIRHYEGGEEFLQIRQRMLSENSGQATLILSIPHNDSSKTVEKVFHATYTWRKVDNSPYIVVIKLLDMNSVFRELNHVDVATMPELLYHRLDLLPARHMCLHLKQLATLDSSTVFLSASAFKQPFDHLSRPETQKMIQANIAFLQGSGQNYHPYFKDDVKNDVAALSRINSAWLRTYHTSNLNDYVIRRYIATPTGVFSSFPGALLPKSYDPTKRMWYERALEFKSHVTLTAPYLDVAGAGYIVTLSHTIYEGRAGNPHQTIDRVVGVMGLDLPVRFIYKLLTDQLTVCHMKGIRCFIVDDKGYLVAHPELVSPDGAGPVELQHITHKEPLVASDILNHKNFVQKQLCNSYNTRTIQRFYQFNTSLSGVLTNLKHGEHCARYLITALPGTNAFLGIVNETCTMRTAFCPCSTVDRLCLNCNRMEQAECECPCECPLRMNFCTGDLYDDDDRNPSCPRPSEQNILVVADESVTSDLKQCYDPKCKQRKTKEDCFGVVDCEWCEIENGTSLLAEPYCATQRQCFGGVLGAASPYHDEIKVTKVETREDVEEEEDDMNSAPVGPVAGGIMGCFLMLALGVYCYRHHVHRRNHHYVTASNESNGPLRRLDNDLEELDVVEEPGHTNAIVLATFENAATISPYRMNTTYRRPTGGDSDHGYSTMTPHEDSEQASTSCMEPINISKDRYRPTSSQYTQKPFALPPPPGHHRRSRSLSPPHATKLSSHHNTIPEHTGLLAPQTTIPEGSHGNHILATAQVHMVDSY